MHPFGVFKAQRSSQGLVVVAGTVGDALNGWFRFDVAVRKLVVIPPIRVKDRFDDGALQPPAPIHGLFFCVIGVESLHDVLPKGLLAEIVCDDREKGGVRMEPSWMDDGR